MGGIQTCCCGRELSKIDDTDKEQKLKPIDNSQIKQKDKNNRIVEVVDVDSPPTTPKRKGGKQSSTKTDSESDGEDQRILRTPELEKLKTDALLKDGPDQ